MMLYLEMINVLSILYFLNQMGKIESNQIKQSIITVISNIRTLQSKHYIYKTLTQVSQFIFFLFFVVNHIPDPTGSLSQVTNIIQQAFNMNPNLANALSIFSLIMLASISCCFGFILKSKNKKITNIRTSRQIAARIINITSYLYLSETIFLVPSFLFIMNNIINFPANQMNVLWFIVIFLDIILIIWQRKIVFFGVYLIPVVFSAILLSDVILSMVFCGAAAIHAYHEKIFLRKFAYVQVIWLQSQMFIIAKLNQSINPLGLLLIPFLILLTSIVWSNKQTMIKSEVQQNQRIFDYIERISVKHELTTRQQIDFMEMMCSFEDSIRNEKSIGLEQEEQQIMDKGRNNLTKQNIIAMLSVKIKYQLMRSLNKQLQIQAIRCKILKQTFTVQILYEIQNLLASTDSLEEFHIALMLHQIIQLIQKNYLNVSEIHNGEAIVQIENCREDICEEFLLALDTMIDFWKELKQGCLDEAEAKNKILTYINYEKQMKEHIEQLQQIRKIDMEINIYNCLISMINFHCAEMQVASKVKNNSPALRIQNTDYILTEKHQIVKISKTLLNHLSLRQSIIGSPVDNIFPPIFKRYIKEIFIKAVDINNSDSKKSSILPFYSEQTSALSPRRVKIQILPCIKSGIRYIIHFQTDEELLHYPFILYSPESDRIIMPSVQYYQYFSITSQQVPKDSLAQDYFDLQLGLTFKLNKNLQSSKLACEMKLRRMSTKKHQTVIPVEIKKFKQYVVGGEEIWLMQIKKKQASDYLDKENKKAFFKFLERQKTMQSCRIPDTSTTFCKIPNPFESMLNERMDSMRVFSHISYLKIALLGLISFVILFISLQVLLIQDINNKSNDLQIVLKSNGDNNDKERSMYLILLEFYQYYQIKTYPESLLNICSNCNITEELSYYESNINQIISQFMYESLMDSSQQKSSSYSLIFNSYNASFQTTSISFIDFLTWIKFNFQINNSFFIVKNEHSIRQFVSTYIPINIEPISKDIQSDQFFLIIILTPMLMLIIGLRVILVKIHLAIRSIMVFYQNLSVQDISQLQFNIQLFKRKIDRKLFGKQKFVKSKTNHKKGKSHCKGFTLPMLLPDSIPSQIQQIKQQQVQQIPKKRQIHASENLLPEFLFKNNYICLALMLIIVYFVIYYTYEVQYYQEASSIFTYANLIQSSSVIICQKAEKYYQAGMEEILPQNERKEWQTDLISTIPFRFDSVLPSFFNDYQKREYQLLNQDLCDYYANNITDPLYDSINCSEVLMGIMSSGYSPTYQLYLKLIFNYGGIEMKDFSHQIRIDSMYPIFMEINYIRIILSSVLSALKTDLDNQIKIYIDNWNSFFSNYLIIGWGCLIIFLICSIFTFNHMSLICKVGIQSFKIIPRKIILKISVTKKMIKGKILEEIERLVF